MPYTIPTPTDIKTLWTQFADVPDNTVQAWINIAARSVDMTWIEADYTPAIELLTAHYLVTNGYGTGAEAEMASQGMSAFETIKSGQLTLSRGAASQNSDGVPAPWNTSRFGVQFYWLARKNKPPMAVAQGNVCFPDMPYYRVH